MLVDLDDVAFMVGPPGAAAGGLWFAAHEAHGAVVDQWLRAEVDLVIAIGPICSGEERRALTCHLPERVVRVDWVMLTARSR